jgi:hypothetical protein
VTISNVSEYVNEGLGLGLGLKLSSNKTLAIKELRQLKSGMMRCYLNTRKCLVWLAGNGGDNKTVKQIEELLHKMGGRYRHISKLFNTVLSV